MHRKLSILLYFEKERLQFTLKVFSFHFQHNRVFIVQFRHCLRHTVIGNTIIVSIYFQPAITEVILSDISEGNDKPSLQLGYTTQSIIAKHQTSAATTILRHIHALK